MRVFTDRQNSVIKNGVIETALKWLGWRGIMA